MSGLGWGPQDKENTGPILNILGFFISPPTHCPPPGSAPGQRGLHQQAPLPSGHELDLANRRPRQEAGRKRRLVSVRVSMPTCSLCLCAWGLYMASDPLLQLAPLGVGEVPAPGVLAPGC